MKNLIKLLPKSPELTAQEILRKAKELKAYRLRYEKYRYYVPNGKAEEFIQLVGNGKTFICLLSAANGVGKTAVGANILAHLMFPCGNPWFNYPLFRKFPYLKEGRIVSDPTTIEQTIIPELKKWFPFDRYDSVKNGKSYESRWGTDTGWNFDLMTYEQEVKEFESKTLGWAWFDEPPPEAIFKATVARMRLGGIIFITATPLTGSAWMYDQIITNPQEGQRAFIEADVEANCKEHGVRGILEHNDIERMVSEYSEEDKQARIFGKFQHLTGLIFKMFNRKVHVIRPFSVNPRDYCVLERLDTHPRNPDAVLWVAYDRKGIKYVIDELYGNFTTPELAQRIKAKAANYRIVDRRIDPSAFPTDQHTSKSLAHDLQVENLVYLPASKERSMAITKVKDALDYQEVNGVMVKAPILYIFDTCERTIWEMEHWQWNEYRGISAESKSPSEKPVDKDDHMMENLGRAVIDDIAFVEMPIRRQQDNIGSIPTLDPY